MGWRLMRILDYYVSSQRDLMWFRVFGVGLAFSCGLPTFSERQGYARALPVGFGWRVSRLKG